MHLILEKREKDRLERPTKIIKLNSSSTTSASERAERDSSSSSRLAIIEIKDEPSSSNSAVTSTHERDLDRHSSTRSLKDTKKDERVRGDRDRDREQRDREREHRNQFMEDIESAATRLKREKRREERFRIESPSMDAIDNVSSKNDYDRSERETRDREYERNERERRDRERDRDLSSVSNESIGSLQQQQRRSQDVLDYEKGKLD